MTWGYMVVEETTGLQLGYITDDAQVWLIDSNFKIVNKVEG